MPSAYLPRVNSKGRRKLDGAKHTFLVLDGQQRLTSLYQAFYGVGEHRYYLDLEKLIEGKDFEEAIFHVRATTKWAKAREDFDAAGQGAAAAAGCLEGRRRRVPAVDSARCTQSDADRGAHETAGCADELNDSWIKTIDDYHFPVVTLSDKTEPDALCTIFETLNRTGVKFSVFELLTARFWPQNINLRDALGKAHGRRIRSSRNSRSIPITSSRPYRWPAARPLPANAAMC